MDIFTDRILPLFQASGKSDMELEKELGLPRSTIYAWKQGKSKSYKNYIAQIASYFYVTPNYFFEEKSEETSRYIPNADDKIKILTAQLNELHFYKSEVEKAKENKNRLRAELNKLTYEAMSYAESSKSDFDYKEFQKNFQTEIVELQKEYDDAVFIETTLQNTLNELVLTPLSNQIAQKYNQLNAAGQKKVTEYIDDLIATGLYEIKKKNDNNNTEKAAHIK